MKTELISIEQAPSKEDIKTLLSEKVYNYYENLCENIVYILNPDREIWDKAGRRGKYFHGYRYKEKYVLVDLYLMNIEGDGIVQLDFHINKNITDKLLRRKNMFTLQMQEEGINSIMELREVYNVGYNFSYKLRKETSEDTFFDIIKIIEIMGGYKI